MKRVKLTKKWLKAHGYHDDCASWEVLRNNYGIRFPINKTISGWYVFISDDEIKGAITPANGG